MKNFLKRTVAVLMILLAIGCIAPFANIVKAAGSGPSSKGLITNTGDKITRAEWLHNLAVVFEMSVEDEIYPDNYFSDLEDTHEYYYDLLLNVNFGVIDIEAGGEVNPDGAVTRSFASHTLNYCLGYQLDSETYTFTDSALCEYPADAQVAINRGWFVLVGGKFCPEMEVTDKEVKAMLDDTEDVIDDSEIDVDYDSKFTFSSEVVEVKDGTELEFNGDVITIKDSSVKIVNGDIFAVYQSGIPLVYKAETVSENGNNIIVTASYIEENVDKYILEADAQGEADFEDVIITPAEGVEVDLNYEEPPVRLFAFGKDEGKKKIANISAKGTINLSDFGYSISYSVEMKNPTIQYAYNLSKRTAQVSFECEIEDKATFKADLLKAGFIEKEVMIYTLSVPGVGGLDVCLKFDLSGSVSVVSKSNFKVGASYSPKDNFRTIKNFSGGSFSLEAKISGSAGIIVKLGVTQFKLVSAYVYAEAGGKASVDLKMYSSGTPKNCVEFAAYVYANYGATFEIDAGIWKYEAKAEEKIWDSKTSPARIVKHYEEEKPVTKCTRGGTGSSGSSGSGGGGSRGNYYTKYDSAYSGGWSDGDNSYGFDKTGKPVQLFEYKLDEEGNATITAYTGNATVVNIPETIDGHKVIAIGKSAFEGQKIYSVDIPDSITDIQSKAFKNCTNLNNINLSSNLLYLKAEAFANTAITNIDIPKSLIECTTTYHNLDYTGYNGPFSDCINLTVVTFEEGTTTIAPRVLAGCKSVTSIKIPETVTSIGSKAFGMCESLNKLTLPNSVTKIGFAAFYGCNNLADINIPTSLTYIDERAFSHTSITNITLPKTLEECESGYENLDYTGYSGPFSDCPNLSSVAFEEGTTRIAPRVLAGCKSVTSIKIPETVTSIGSKAFGMCESLNKLTLPNSVTKIGFAAFYGCNNLADINIPTSLTYIDERAFSHTSITNITLPKTLEECESGYENLDYTGYSGPFSDCPNLSSVTFEEGTTKIAPRVLAGCNGVITVNLPQTIITIGEKAFGECTSLSNITLPITLEKIEFCAFRGCLALKNIQLNQGLVTLGEYAFASSGLENIIIPNTVTEMYGAIFKDCEKLSKVILPEGRVNIPNSVFENCISLKSITLPSTVQNILEEAFKNCSALEKIVWNNNLLKIETRAFQNCDAIKELILPNSIVNIDGETFADCDGLTKAILPNSVKTIGKGAFYDCDTLKTVTLGNSLEAIPNSAFEHCDVLTEILLPYRVTSIGSDAFKDCVKFTSITIPRATTKIADNAFSYLDRLTIYGVSGAYAETYAKEKGIKFVNKAVPATKVELSNTELSLANGATTTLVLNITPANFTDAVSWKSSDEKVITIDDTGKVTAKGIGSATIKVDVGSVSASCKVTVVQPVTKVNIDKSSLDLEAHETYQLKVTVSPDTAANKSVKWSSSDETVATVDQNGLVTTLKKGSTTIKCEALDGSGKYDTCTINVKNNGVIATTVSELESTHDYPVDCTDFWQYTIKGASKLDVTFDNRTNIEDGFDYLYIYDSNGKEVGTYTGTALAGKTITVNGDTVRLQLASDKSGTAWGFKVTDVKQTSGSGTHTNSYTSTVTQKATCLKNGTKTFTCACGDTYTEAIPTVGHTAIKQTRQATLDKDGAYVTSCAVCNTVIEETSFSRPTLFKLSTSTCTYNGKTRTPSITVKDASGKTLKEGTDYKISYPSGRKLPGKYDITVLLIGDYLGEKHLTFTINPKAPTDLSATQTTNSIKLTWSKSTGVTGYQIYKYDAKTEKYVKVKSTSSTSLSVSKLSSGTSYKFRVRAYKKVDGGYIYSSYIYITTATKTATPTLKVTSIEKGKATLSWTNVSGESGYQIYYSTSKSSGYKKYSNVGVNKSKSTVSGLTRGKTYYFKVRTYKKVDGKTIYGDFSSVKSIKVK